VICAADREGRVLFYKQLSFNGFAQWAATIPPCTFGMEACGSAHHWGRRLTAYGHIVRLMATEFVKPFRKSQGAKNDRNDAQAILTAVRQPEMRFVSIKSVDQQAVLAWHCMRRGWSDDRTSLINRMRGLLAEFGFWLAQSPEALKGSLPRLLENETPLSRMRTLLSVAHEELGELEQRIELCEIEIRAQARQSDEARRLEAIIGMGPITASAVAATVANARDFKNGRQMAAWLGAWYRSSSVLAVKPHWARLPNAGDTYLRGLLTGGARSALISAREDHQRNARGSSIGS